MTSEMGGSVDIFFSTGLVVDCRASQTGGASKYGFCTAASGTHNTSSGQTTAPLRLTKSRCTENYSMLLLPC